MVGALCGLRLFAHSNLVERENTRKVRRLQLPTATPPQQPLSPEIESMVLPSPMIPRSLCAVPIANISTAIPLNDFRERRKLVYFEAGWAHILRFMGTMNEDGETSR